MGRPRTLLGRYKQIAKDLEEDTRDYCTYIVRAGDTDYVKIGRALNVEKRVMELQVGNHEELRIVRKLFGDDEADFHAKFADRRVRGEWFLFHPDMLTFETETEQKFREYKTLLMRAEAA